MEQQAITAPPRPADERVVHTHTTLSTDDPGEMPSDGVRHLDVFVDDMLMFAQGSHATLDLLRRQLFHVTDSFLRPNDEQDTHRKEPISTSKLAKGDGCWTTYKKMLGWMVDSVRKTIELPPERHQRLLKI